MIAAVLHSLLEASADVRPAKIALICGRDRNSYDDLEVWSNRLANRLLSEGIQRGDRVGIYLDNSFEAVISIFATLKAAGAFVPINPAAKADKLAYVLNDCRAKALIADPGRHVRNIECKVITPIAEGSPGHRPHCKCIDLDLATILYTSGSTRQAKSERLTHYL